MRSYFLLADELLLFPSFFSVSSLLVHFFDFVNLLNVVSFEKFYSRTQLALSQALVVHVKYQQFVSSSFVALLLVFHAPLSVPISTFPFYESNQQVLF